MARTGARGGARGPLLVAAGALAVVACGAGGAAAGYAVHESLPVRYAADASVLVLPTAGGLDSSVAGSRSAADIQIETEAELMGSAQVAAAAAERLDGRLSPAQLLDGTEVTVPTNSQVLQVAVQAGSPELARDGAMAVASAYLDRRTGEAKAAVTAVADSLRAQVGDLTERLEANAEEIGGLADDATSQRSLLESQRSLLVDQIADINSRLVALDVDGTRGGEIITEATLPTAAASPDLLVDVGGGAAVGTLLGAGLVLGAARLRARRGRTGAEGGPQLPVLATVGVGADGDDVAAADLAVLRRLGAEVRDHDAAGGPTVVVGVGDRSVRSRVALGLAESSAADGAPALLVLTEPPAGHLAAALPAGATGLLDAVRGEVAATRAVVGVDGSPVRLLGPGRPGREGEAVEVADLDDLWGRLERDLGTVTVQTSSSLESPLAQSVLQTAGRIVVVVESSPRQTRELTSALAELDWLGLTDRVVGVIVVVHRPSARQVLGAAAAPAREVADGRAGRQEVSGGRRDGR
ncbi:hypothetical protein [Vallicoccus soli]|uniref:Polysaccharide chain length determinant N-terminal domain-containing protein n=1 Tax=Vallicoccus soli TaxID=2339232 RepID=A0A3A3Z0V8_9ACTN|nr:hypothetical protein [Vallicoccus soli]RJK97889.1 hypothetical protein D5H78_02660 [Vallicoccus soli]